MKPAHSSLRFENFQSPSRNGGFIFTAGAANDRILQLMLAMLRPRLVLAFLCCLSAGLLHRVQAQEIHSLEIRIGQPKVWRYDRLFPLEDGLLRDVEGINLSGLTGLDPSEVNSRVVDLLQSYISASVNYDQTAGIQNAIAMQAFNATRNSQMTQLKDQADTAQALANEKAQIAKALRAAIDVQTKDVASDPSCGGAQCKADAQQVSALTAQVNAINSASAAVGSPSFTPPSPPSLSGVSGGTPITTPSLSPLLSGSDFMKNALSADPKTVVGPLPARERLQNFITLLNERLTNQLALSLDEKALNGKYVPVVMEFDVAVEPKSSRKNEQAVSTFILAAGDDCIGSPKTYNLYPSMAAFNVAAIQGQSSGFYANGGFKGLFLGSNISYQRQHDHLTSALSQSVYVSGFLQGSSFGWYYGPPSYSNVVRPGIYTTFAVVLIPTNASGDACKVTINASSWWSKKNGKRIDPSSETLVDGTESLVPSASADAPLVTQVQYWPHYGTASSLQTDINVVTVEFKHPIDPNLLITVSGKLLKRVRDWRGRATTPPTNDSVSVTDSSGATHQVSIGRGLLESNIDEADTWIAVSQTKVMLKISQATASAAGASDFPDIRLLIPSGENWDLRDAVDFHHYSTKIAVGDHEFYGCHPKLNEYQPAINDGCMKQPNSMWLPLFMESPERNHRLRAVRVNASGADAPDNSGNGDQTYIFLSVDDGALRLSSNSQVILLAPAHSRFAYPIPLECATLANGLLCHLHPQTIAFNSPYVQLPGQPGPQPNNCLVVSSGSNSAPIQNATPLCDWRSYRLQLQVNQAANDADGLPGIFATADFPTGSTAFPVFGPALNATNNGHSQWQITFPAYYAAVAPGDVCIANDSGDPVKGAKAEFLQDPSGDVGRALNLRVTLPSSELQQALRSRMYLFNGTCAAPDFKIGALNGINDALLPGAITLTRTGANNEIYRFTGTNMANIQGLIFREEKGPEISVSHFQDGLVADLSNSKVPTGDSVLFFAVDSAAVPAIACWDQQDSSNPPQTKHQCGQVVVQKPKTGEKALADKAQISIAVAPPPSGIKGPAQISKHPE